MALDNESVAQATVRVPSGVSFWRKMLAFAGPGFLVAVGYMDPGNWATDLAAGSQFGYKLLFVILLSNLIAMLMQHLCVRLGVATGRDLAQMCRDRMPRPAALAMWVLAEIAIAACDLAEVIGSAIALQLLFGIPLVVGCVITVADVFLILLLQQRGFRWIEAIVITLILTIAACFALEMLYSKPDPAAVARGFLPTADLVKEPAMLLIAIGILGATVMPHNLYLHSAVVQTRAYERNPAGRKEAIRFATLDSTGALFFALFLNAAILILAAAAFHENGRTDVAEIQEAHRLLSPVLGVGAASALFAIALLAAGQNATLTGTLAGQIVMEGFLRFRMAPWLRRMTTRMIAVVPAVIIIAVFGEKKSTDLLLWSQVILSLQLGFAVVPLVWFTSKKAIMGEFTSPRWVQALGWSASALVVLLNAWFLFDLVRPLFGGKA